MFSNKQVVETFNNEKKGYEDPNKKFSHDRR